MATGVFISECFHCKCEMWLPQSLYDAALHGKGTITFYCAYGHGQVFAKGDTDLDKMRQERDRLKQDVAYWQDVCKETSEAEKTATKLASTRKGVITKLRNRAGAGTCPCCHRTFRQMTLHMQSKHPGFRAEQVA